jgi:16S rRNA (guanine966-N2)-methyltransferase
LCRGDIFRIATRLKGLAADLIFIDPPYDMPDAAISCLLETLAQQGSLAYGSLLVIERGKASQISELLPQGLRSLDVKCKGETSLHYVSFTPAMGTAERKI